MTIDNNIFHPDEGGLMPSWFFQFDKARLHFKLLEHALLPAYFAPMKYPVILIPSEEGFAVACPSLPGCWSQGKTQAEALTNIREAIQLWLEVAEEDARAEAGRESGTFAEVTV